MRGRVFLEHAIMITMSGNCACFILLDVMANLYDMTIFLTVKALCEFIIIIIELAVLELIVKEQLFIN